MLDFYAEVTIEAGIFVPVGNAGWYPRGGARARFGQQPLEAAAKVERRARGARAHRRWELSRACADGQRRFAGRNVHRAVLARDGGCSDGLDAHGPDRNMGVESTVASLLAGYAMAGAARDPITLRRRLA